MEKYISVNPTIKEEFLNEISSNRDKKEYKAFFDIISPIEDIEEKNVFDFDLDELTSLFDELKLDSLKQVNVYCNYIEEYTDYSIRMGHRASNINHIIYVSDDWKEEVLY